MKKIMFYRPMYYIGGTEIAILSLIRNLKGYEIYIGYTDDTSSKEMLDKYKKYAKVIKIDRDFDTKIDTLIICSPYRSALEVNTLVNREKTILWFHHFGDRESSIFMDEKFYKIIDYIVVVSETSRKIMLKQDYASRIKDKIIVIYNIIDIKDIIEKSGKEIELELSNELNLISVGRVCYEKGFDRNLILAKLLKKHNIDFKWYIVGGNYYTEVEEEIKNKYKKLKDNFVFTGFLKNPYNIIKKCDYLVLLSDNETWGLVLTEAKILGVPCIVTDFDVAYEQILDNKTGIILSRDDTSSYEQKIDLIIKNKDIYKQNLKEFKFSNENTLKKWKKIL